jgi:hypothetical protein
MKKLLLYIIILFYVSMLLLPASASAADANSPAAVPRNIMLFNEDQKFDQPKNSVSYWFNIPSGAELADCYVNLHISFSDTLIANRSNLSLTVNDSPIDTKWINDLKSPATNWWKVTIPPTILKVNAINEIKIQSNQRSIEGDCADIDNESNWMIIHKDSELGITVNKYADALLSNMLPIYGDNLLNKYTIASDFVLAKMEDKDSLSSLLKLSSSIGKIYSDKNDLDYNVTAGSSDNNSLKSKIFIGPISDWATSTQLNLPTPKLGPAQGFISIRSQPTSGTTPSSGNDRTSFNTLITGNDPEGLNKAINFLASKQLMDQVKSNSLLINSDAPIERVPFAEKQDGLYKFSDFGYGNLNLAGAFHQKTYLTFVQPQGIQSANGSYLNIKFNHSKVLVSDRSIMTVYVNGIAANSVKLSAANAEDGTLKVVIPEEALKSSVINVGIECYNYLGVIDCSKDYDESAWTAVSQDSEICLLPGNAVILPSLSSFPYIYTKQEKDVPQVVLGLPNPLNRLLLEAAALIATRAGQSTGETLNWNLIGSGNTLTPEQEKMDIVYLGSYKNINLPQSVKNQLYVASSGDGTFNIKAGLKLQPETLQNKVLIQVVRSPWVATKRLYVISYDNDNNLNTLKKLLSGGDLLHQMTGEIAVVDADNEIHNFTYEEKSTVSPIKTIGDRVHDVENLTHLPWWLMLICILVIVSGAVIMFGPTKKTHKIRKT